MANQAKFFFDAKRGDLDKDGIPSPTAPPEEIYNMIGDGAIEKAPEIVPMDDFFKPMESTLPAPAPLAPAPEDESVLANKPPIEPPDAAYQDLQVPGTLTGPYGQAFTLTQLRDAIGTDRYTFEAKRVRSASPCRVCKHGSEIYGIATLKSRTFTGIARRILCDRFKTDTTENMIISCGGFEEDPRKAASVEPIRKIEKQLRDTFQLTAPPPTQWDAEELAEENQILSKIYGRKPDPTVEEAMWEVR